MHKKLILIFGLLFFLFLVRPVEAEEILAYPVRIHVFHSVTCPHCKEELKFLETLKKKYPQLEVRDYEVSGSFKNQNLFQKVLEQYGLAGSVPTNIIGDKVIVGFDNAKGKGKEIEQAIDQCSQNACASWLDGVLGLPAITEKITIQTENQTATEEKPIQDNNQNQEKISFSFLGKKIEVSKNSSVFLLGLVLGLADGINPCMFSVLLFLLTYLMAIGSRKKAIKAGLVFAATTFLVYFLFMFGLLKVIAIFQIAQTVRIIVSILALVAGLIMVKDFFFYGKGISLEIPTRFKPTIENLIKKGTIPSAILLAIFSSIVELPCTSGLPLAYLSILSQKQLNPLGYLALYNLFFVIPLFAIIIAVSLAWAKVEKVEEWRKSSREYMRLVAGILLLLLALALWKNWI